MNRPATTLIWVCAAALLGAGCASLQSTEVAEPDYASDAETNLRRGDESLESHNFVEAERYFEYVKSKYPFLEAAKIAELRLADTDFEQDQFLEARDRYLSFVKLHPTHSKVDYAAFRGALTHYKDIPSDFFLLPPSREKDQVEVKNALRAMGEFARQFPKSFFAAEALRIADECRKRLAQHELYVADFYAHRERWTAVVGRLNTVVQDFSGLGFDEQAYLGLYDAYSRLNDGEKAQQTLKTILEKLPGTPAAQKARSLLGTPG